MRSEGRVSLRQELLDQYAPLADKLGCRLAVATGLRSDGALCNLAKNAMRPALHRAQSAE